MTSQRIPRQITFLTWSEYEQMQTIWSHIATGITSVAGMGIFQKIILSMQDKKIEKACKEMKEALKIKQDSVACGLMNAALTENLKELKHTMERFDETAKQLTVQVAILNNNRKNKNEVK